jgi:hypothetical protein
LILRLAEVEVSMFILWLQKLMENLILMLKIGK